MRVPEVNVNTSELEFIANKVGEKISKTIIVSNPIPETTLQGKWSVLPPPWRNDIDGSADLVEEIIRIYGYENIPEAKLFSKDVIPKPAITRENKRLFSVKSLLAGRGMMECITYSFISFDTAKLFSIDNIDQLIISNPISSDLDLSLIHISEPTRPY